MELIKARENGQWELVKADSPEYKGQPDYDYLSYKNPNKEGQLPQDYGTKGQLHGVSGRAKKETSKEKMSGKVPTPVSSSYADNHPGQKPL